MQRRTRDCWRALGVFAVTAAFAAEPATAQDPDELHCEEFPIPMSDDVRLYAHRTWKGEDSGPRPIILSITPYGHGKSAPTSGPAPCARVGDERAIDEELSRIFAHVVVDLRGSGSSEGLWDLIGSRSQQDIQEVVDWVAGQSWSDGRILVEGNSGVGLFGFYTVQNPAVKLALVHATCADFYRGCARHGGGLLEIGNGFLALVKAAWAASTDDRVRLGLHLNPPAAEQAAALLESDVAVATRDLWDEYWQERNPSSFVADAAVPVVYTTDPYDIIPTSLHDAYFATPSARFVFAMGHGTEGGPQSLESYGDVVPAYLGRLVRHFVLGEDNGAQDEPPVVVLNAFGGREEYRAGRAAVRFEDAWPLSSTEWTRLYLWGGPSGSAPSLNDGALTLEAPEEAMASDETPLAPAPGFKSDPRINSWFAAPSQVWRATNAGDHQQDERAALTYTTPSLAQNVEITGPGVLRLFASSTLENFDWVIRLTDVWPDGRSEWVTDGILRASLRRVDEDGSMKNANGDIIRPRHEFDEHEPVPIGEVVEYLIEVHPTSNVFRAGHRIRLDVLGVGAAPLDAALMPGAGVGTVTIHRDADHPSSLLLPVIPARCQDSTPLVPEIEPIEACAQTLAEALQ